MPKSNDAQLSAKKLSADFAGKEVIIEYGKLARLADGAVTLRCGDTVILATAVIGDAREGGDFFPLTVDYEERLYAAGKISGSRFIKREGRPTENAILTSRLIDRPLRPLFDKATRNEIQIIVTVLSLDMVNDPDILAITAASAALCLAGAPFDGPVGAARVGLLDGKLVVNPTYAQQAESKLDLVVAGTKTSIMMVEAGASEVSEDQMIEAIELAHKEIQSVIGLQEKLKTDAKETKEVALDLLAEDVTAAVAKFASEKAAKLARQTSPDKSVRSAGAHALVDEVLEHFGEEFEPTHTRHAVEKLMDKSVREAILNDSIRPDGRKLDEIRPITAEVGVLPRTHGSGLFTRGETQALTTVTLGPPSAAQMIDTMEEDGEKRYMHHYNFPPYSTGETGRVGSPKRREIGHGALAERALVAVLPAHADFPYTMRLVSEVLSSNGSTSMASTCGSTLGLMDAGVPIARPVSGIAMGLVFDKESGKYAILSDILGDEDFAGDMDFKVAGTTEGITALQMDIKAKGLSMEIMKAALAQAKDGRAHILGKMLETIKEPRAEISKYAPRITTVKIDPEKIRTVIGKGGEMINRIVAETGASVDIEDDGTITIAAVDQGAAQHAIEWIEQLTAEPEVRKTYSARVTRVMDFGAFMEIMPGREGLLHISQYANERIDKISDYVKIGDEFDVRLTEIDSQGRLNLSRKVLL
jgi:polyribonucleotide nucleotidyltransferase